jgi:4-carboxymuconolactone decarboxylase
MDDRFARGSELLNQIHSGGGDQLVAALGDIAPDLARAIIEFGFGEIYVRPGLALRDRQIATVAALAALGTARPQLVAHIEGALAVGVTRQEIVEIIMQMALYGGFPAAMNAVDAARAAFAADDARTRGESPPTGS